MKIWVHLVKVCIGGFLSVCTARSGKAEMMAPRKRNSLGKWGEKEKKRGEDDAV